MVHNSVIIASKHAECNAMGMKNTLKINEPYQKIGLLRRKGYSLIQANVSHFLGMLGKDHLGTAIKEMQLISENFQTENPQEVMLSCGHVMPSLVHQTLSLPLPWGWGRENGLGNLVALSCALQECL